MMAVTRSGQWYRGYTLDDTEYDVRWLFNERYGREPREIFRSGAIQLAGPIEKEEEDGSENGQK
jgi:hypothetical protein